MRAQREAAEKLAQQRVAAARERSLRASADALTILAPHKAEARTAGKPAARSAGGDQPRFTFAQEEIVAARQETSFAPGTPSDPAPKMEAPVVPDAGVGKAPPPAPDEPKLYSQPQRPAAGAPEYGHEDDAMFEDAATFEDNTRLENGQPTLQAAPPRASAADYSAAYREFEDEFEEEPRRRSGPLLLLASLAALAVISGGAIYLYQGSDQQVESAPPVAEASNVPVIAAPEEPAKAEPPAPQEPQQAAAPTTRKEIYDRIIGEETLEPERIVPTEEAPLRQIQQPRATEAGGESQSGEPLPLPLPPPPGTGIGEQGDLLVPGAANIQQASAEPESVPEPEPDLSFPEPREAADADRRPTDGGASMAAAPEPDSRPDSQPDTGNAAPAEAAASAAAKLRGTAAVAEAPDTPVSSRPSIYPEVTEPLAYPRVRTTNSPPLDQTGEPESRDALQAEQDAEEETAPVTERMAALATEPEADQIAEPEPEIAEAEEELADAEAAGEPTSDVPLPKAKPEPPVRVAAAPQPAPQPQAPQPQAAAPAGSGPVQIIPTDQAQAPIAREAQPEAQSAPPRRRTVGREPDPLAGPGSTFASSLTDILNVAPSQQVASVEPAEISQPQPAPAQPTQADPAGGYLVQLASFRSEAEALSAYQQLAQRHPQLVGNLGSRVREASLGQTGSFWRLGVGPLSNRTEATRLCNALIAAGEKDCLVRQN
ncbi:MAG TPA: SPOR domain-containing protein [Aestuariivirgaceae bacterium]|nr:SPOR domain-containing protein [Aestuariivirgaceae bacterium]